MKYTFFATPSPPSNNDVVELFINPTSGSVEASPSASAIGGLSGGSDASTLALVRITQDGNTPTATIDAIRVSTTYAEALPVELTYFRAQPTEAGHVRVQWGTASEKNSHYFAIERSADARTFTEVARREAAGTIQEPLRYEITDTQPLSGTSYYRLRQVDLDGTAHLYRAVSVNLGGASPQLRVFPNPSDGRQLLVRLAGAGDATVSLRTISGAALAFWQSQSGADELALTPNQPLAPGVYLLSVKTNQQTLSQKIVVR